MRLTQYLVDEARTPLIISGPGDKSTHLYADANTFIKTLKEDNYEIDEKAKNSIINRMQVYKKRNLF